MTEKEFKRLEKNEYCPFLRYLEIKQYTRLKEIAKLKDKDSKVYELREKNSTGYNTFENIKIEELVIADKKTYEGSFIKIFQTDFLCSLTNYELKIFVYITKYLELNNNKIILDINKIAVETNLSEPRKIYDGLNGLINKKIIAKHVVENVYYVNPSIIFRGANRKVLFTHKNY